MKIVGIDATEKQVRIAKMLQQFNIIIQDGIEFLNYEASTLSIGQVDKIYSVEVFQHIARLDLSLKNLYGLLKPGGKISIATFFLNHDISYQKKHESFPLTRTGQEYLATMDSVVNMMTGLGFLNVSKERLGKHVFHGYQQWIEQCKVKTDCSFVYDKLYREGIIDYFLITAEK